MLYRLLATMSRITPSELGYVLLWSVGLMALTAMPYSIAARAAGPGRHFAGFLWGVDDGSAHVAWVRQAAEGRVLLRNQYTTKEQNPRFFSLFFFTLGRVSRWTGLAPLTVLTGSRYALGALCLLALYLLAAQITPDRSARFLGLVLASVSSGLGWIVVLAGQHGGLLPGLSAFPMDVADGWQAQPEAILFSSVLLNPLFSCSLALASLVMAQACRLTESPTLAPAAWAGLLLLVLGNIHGYDIFPLHATLLLWLGCSWLFGRVTLKRALGSYALLLAVSLPAPIWSYLGAQADPAYLAKINTPTLSPRPFDVAVGYGLVLVLALCGTWAVSNTGTGDARRLNGRLLVVLLVAGAGGLVAQILGAPEGWLKLPALALPALAAVALWGRRAAGDKDWRPLILIVWAACGAAALYAPVPFQRKMIEGLHIPLCVLGGIALAAALSGASFLRGMERGTRVFVVLALVLATVPSNLLFVSECLRHTRENNRSLLAVRTPPAYLSQGEWEGLGWLAERTSERDVVLSSSLTGCHIPAYAPCTVWVGHWAETLDFARCLSIAEQFYKPGTSQQARRSILELVRPTYVWYGPQERLLQEATGALPVDPCADLPELRLVADNAEIRLYQVTPTLSAESVAAPVRRTTRTRATSTVRRWGR